jgi:hypothetical protein
MSDPTHIQQAGLRTRVLVKIGLAIIACLVAVMGISLGVIFGQLTNATTEVGLMRTGLSALNERLGRIEKTVEEARVNLTELIQNERRTVSVTPDRTVSVTPERTVSVTPERTVSVTPERPVSVTPDMAAGFYVTEQEAKLIREFLKVPPKNANLAAKMALWMRLPAQATKPLPEVLMGKLEKLKGLRYAVDANNAIALIEPSTHIVIAVI